MDLSQFLTDGARPTTLTIGPIPGIYNVPRYIQSKLLVNNTWELPKKIRPTDFDFAVESNGMYIVADLKCDSIAWDDLSRGQRLCYERLAVDPCETNPANMLWRRRGVLPVLCRHNVSCSRDLILPINTRDDVISFSVWNKTELPGDYWPAFVHWFVTNGSDAIKWMRSSQIELPLSYWRVRESLIK